MIALRHVLPAVVLLLLSSAMSAETVIDLSGYRPDCEVRVAGFNSHLIVTWPTGKGEDAEVALDLTGEKPLIERLSTRQGNEEARIFGGVDPIWFLTVGSRQPPADKPPENKWEVFFDNPHRRPHETFTSKLSLKRARVTGSGKRATVAIDELAVGPFSGTVEFTFFAGSRLMRIDAAVETDRDLLAVFYDAGLVADSATWNKIAWIDTEGQPQSTASRASAAKPLKVRHRTIIAEGARGTVACFPPPHQFQFPRDYSTNLDFVWHGEGYQGQQQKVGFGIRQNKDGGGNYVPWFNAPPGVTHRLGTFYLLTSGSSSEALSATLQYTHGDRFVALPGYKTFTSHYHMAATINAMKERAAGIHRTSPPEYVNVLKNMGVNLVHQGEFHGDGHPRDPGPLRLPEMQGMFEECARWSSDDLLLMPGEEANVHLGLALPGKNAGHWMSFFPRPVYWTMVRGPEQPFVEDVAPYGKVYHVGDRGDMIRLLKEERGLAWTAHPRIKASNWTPDIFRNEDFFLAPFWLGGAWKALPADLSREKLGERVLNLMDDMANWGQRKYVPGEVDVFTIDHTHELYGHMNVNYMRLDRVPRFDEGWQPVLDGLSRGQFFVTTGEILIPSFTLGGKESGDVLKATHNPAKPELVAEVQWTFPLAFAEIISGDGEKIYRERIDLADTTAFGSRTFKFTPDLKGRRWARFEIWDVAANGAFTQPVWLE